MGISLFLFLLLGYCVGGFGYFWEFLGMSSVGLGVWDGEVGGTSRLDDGMMHGMRM
jgi:hypothetical protein